MIKGRSRAGQANDLLWKGILPKKGGFIEQFSASSPFCLLYLNHTRGM